LVSNDTNGTEHPNPTQQADPGVLDGYQMPETAQPVKPEIAKDINFYEKTANSIKIRPITAKTLVSAGISCDIGGLRRHLGGTIRHTIRHNLTSMFLSPYPRKSPLRERPLPRVRPANGEPPSVAAEDRRRATRASAPAGVVVLLAVVP
jgi:hypothetical protein